MASPVKDALEAYLAGRVKPERVVAAVVTQYYRDAGSGMRDGLRPVLDVIERASPGVVELVGRAERPGFGVRLAERPFPKQYEAELRQAAESYLRGEQAGEAGRGKGVPRTEPAVPPRPGMLGRVLDALRRLLGGT